MPNGHYDDPDGSELLSTYAEKINKLERELEHLRKKHRALRKMHSNVKRLGRKILEVAPRVIKCTSVEWDRAVIQFRKSTKKEE